MEILGPISTFAKSSSVRNLEVTSDAAFTHSRSCLIFGLLFLLWLKNILKLSAIMSHSKLLFMHLFHHVWLILIHCSPVLIKHPCSVSRLFRMLLWGFWISLCLFSYTGSPSTLELTLRVWFWLFPTVWKSTSVNQTTLHPCVPITSLRLCELKNTSLDWLIPVNFLGSKLMTEGEDWCETDGQITFCRAV